MKNGVICYFSGTGNTKLACEYMKQHLSNFNVDLFNIAYDSELDLNGYEFLGFATFTDWFDPPFLVKRFIEGIPQQNGKPVFLFNTCAGMAGKTLRTLYDWCSKKGLKVIDSFTLFAPESYPPLNVKGMTKEKNPSESNLSEFREFVKRLNVKLSYESDELFEIRPKIGLINTILPRFSRERSKLTMGNKLVNKDLCNKCGQCEMVCPYKAIRMSDNPIFNEARCCGCWVCFNSCSQKAIYTRKINGGHYRVLPAYKQKLRVDTDIT